MIYQILNEVEDIKIFVKIFEQNDYSRYRKLEPCIQDPLNKAPDWDLETTDHFIENVADLADINEEITINDDSPNNSNPWEKQRIGNKGKKISPTKITKETKGKIQRK